MKLVDTWVKFTARVPDTMTCVVHQSCSWGKKGVFLTLTVPPTACSPPMTQRAQGLKDVIWLSPSVSRSSLVLWVLSMILQAPVRFWLMGGQKTVMSASQTGGQKEQILWRVVLRCVLLAAR